jgi:hypothetical protein
MGQRKPTGIDQISSFVSQNQDATLGEGIKRRVNVLKTASENQRKASRAAKPVSYEKPVFQNQTGNAAGQIKSDFQVSKAAPGVGGGVVGFGLTGEGLEAPTTNTLRTNEEQLNRDDSALKAAEAELNKAKEAAQTDVSGRRDATLKSLDMAFKKYQDELAKTPTAEVGGVGAKSVAEMHSESINNALAGALKTGSVTSMVGALGLVNPTNPNSTSLAGALLGGQLAQLSQQATDNIEEADLAKSAAPVARENYLKSISQSGQKAKDDSLTETQKVNEQFDVEQTGLNTAVDNQIKNLSTSTTELNRRRTGINESKGKLEARLAPVRAKIDKIQNMNDISQAELLELSKEIGTGNLTPAQEARLGQVRQYYVDKLKPPDPKLGANDEAIATKGASVDEIAQAIADGLVSQKEGQKMIQTKREAVARVVTAQQAPPSAANNPVMAATSVIQANTVKGINDKITALQRQYDQTSTRDKTTRDSIDRQIQAERAKLPAAKQKEEEKSQAEARKTIENIPNQAKNDALAMYARFFGGR